MSVTRTGSLLKCGRTVTVATVACVGATLGSSIAADIEPSNGDRLFHDRLLVLDTHLDTPYHLGRPGWDIRDRHTYGADLSQVDFPRMRDGGLDGGFWVIYTPQGELTAAGYARAREHALHSSAQIREMVARNARRFSIARTAADAKMIATAGKIVVYQSIENSYPLGEDLGLLDTFYENGVRLVGPVHYAANQFADSATAPAKWHGLSPLGVQLIRRANELGMVVDASHASDAAFDQMLDLSKTPIVLSHSGLKAILDHPRNIDDERLRKLAAAGGVIQVAIVSHFLVRTPVVREFEALQEELGSKLQTYSSAQAADLAARIRKVVAEHRLPRAGFDDFMRSLVRAIDVAGIDHVGIGADWDGGAGVEGLEEISDLPKITAALRRAGYSDTDIGKVMGGNVLRVLERAERYATEQHGSDAGP